MKICLINPKGIAEFGTFIPQGLLQITAELKKAGYNDCQIIDFNNPDIKISYDYLNNFDVVGLSVMTTQLRHAVEIADSLDKNVRVVWGGVHCILDPLSILKKYRNHFVISGDGELSFVRLMDCFKNNESLDSLHNQPGISFYHNEPIMNNPSFIKNIDNLTDVNYYDLPNLEKYLFQRNYYFKKMGKMPALSVLTSRGCSWDCSFCINSIYRKYKAVHRSKSINKIRRETEKIIDDFNIRIVLPMDEDFFVNKQLVEDWKNYAIEKKFLWAANCRYNYVNSKMITGDKLRDWVESGLFAVGMSIEAGSEDLRNRILNKHVNNADIYKAAEIIKDSVGSQLAVNTSFIIDFPGDTRLNKIETIKWMDFLSKNINITFSGPQIYRLYPGSRLYEMGTKHEYGDIDYYLNNVLVSGEFKADITNYFESRFYSNTLRMFFNSRFKFFELHEDRSGRLRFVITSSGQNLILKIILGIFFLTIRLRLKFDFWKFFFEPFLIGWIDNNFSLIFRKAIALKERIFKAVTIKKKCSESK